MKKWICICLCLTIFLTGCEKPAPASQPAASDITTELDVDALFSDRDLSGTYTGGEAITLTGTTAQTNARGVSIDGSTVTVTAGGVYILTGSLDGMVIVDCDKTEKVQLVLAGAAIHSQTSAPIYVRQADKVFLTLEGENTLSNGGSFAAIDDHNIDSVIFSRDDLTLNGTGSLTVKSPAGHGIVSKNELTVTGGSYSVTTAQSGLNAEDWISIAGGSFTLACGKDGIHAEHDEDTALGCVYIQDGTFSITAAGDGISAGGSFQIDGGSYEIVTGGGSENGEKHTADNWGSMPGGPGGGRGPGREAQLTATVTTQDSTSIKGIKSGSNLVINGGTFSLNCADDAIHSNADLAINGGTFTIATGDDGIHAEGTLDITGGAAQITESYEGLEALHIRLQAGTVTLTATDDGLNAAGGTDQSGRGGRDQMGRPGGMGGMHAGNGSIVISGGTLEITASGDGIDANGCLEITGGKTTVSGPTQGDTATLDYDSTATISGGTFIGTGAAGMAQTFSDSKQGVLALSVGNMRAGTKITLTDAQGNVLLEHTPQLNFAVVILSCPQMTKGESYTVTVGTQSQSFPAA